MAVLKEERDRILSMIEAGQVSADEAGQLLDALEVDEGRTLETSKDRIMRLRVTSTNPKQRRHLSATVPVNLVRAGLQLGGRLLPQLSNSALEDLLRSIDTRATGRLLDLHDLEQGERLEIFVE